MIVNGCCSSVAERRQLKPEALELTPGDTTYLSSPLLFQRSTEVTIQIVSLIRHNHYQSSDIKGVLSDGLLPAVISLIDSHINYIHSK